ncbi:MAG: GNAT family N-acetyltransferase [Calditrichaeota bacterium]|nr:GNAT family N-acetyltransferase [Calditrichota bacterium]
MQIFEIKEYSIDILNALNKLLPQLSESAKPLSKNRLKSIIDSESSFLFVAEDKMKICGMLTLVIVKIPTSTKAVIEDVVVDKESLGKGVGKKLTLHAIDFAKENGVSTVNLTSSPWRTAANSLYKKLGFEKRDTNVYKLDI